MRRRDGRDGDPRWLNAAFAVAGTIFVMTLLINFWNAVSTLLR
jgi:hypothetical protein